MMFGVSSRTRSKSVHLFSGVSLGRSSSKRKKIDEDVMSLESVSGSKRRKEKNESFVFPKKDEVIFIDDDDYDEEGWEDCDVDVKKEVKSYESGGSCEIGDKNGNFVVDDEKCGWERENPIILDLNDDDDEQFVGSVAGRKKVKVDESGGSGKFVDKDVIFFDVDDSDETHESDEDDDDDDSDESEDETSDEDFNVDEVKETIDDDSSVSSFADDVDNDDEEEEVEEEEEEEKKKKGSRKDLNGRYFNVVEMLAREVNGEKSEEEEEEEKKKEGSKKYFNVVEEVSREVNDEKIGEEEKEEKKVDEIFADVIVDNNEKEVRDEQTEKKNVNEISDCDVVSSNDVIVDDDEEKVRDEEKKPNNVVEEDKEDNLDPLWHECHNCLMEEEKELLREVKDQKSGVSKTNNEKIKIKTSEVQHSGYDSATASTTFNPMKGSSSKRYEASETHAKCVEISMRNEASETLIAKSVEMKVKNVSHDDDLKVNVAKSKAKESAKPIKNVKVGDSVKGKERHGKGLGVGGVSSVQTKQEKVKDLDKPTENVKVGSVEGKDQPVKGLGVGGVSSVQTKQEEVKDLDEPTENVKVGSVEGKERNVKGLGVGGVSSVQTKQEKVKDLDKPTENVKVGSVEGKDQPVKGLGVGGVSSVQTKQEEVKDLDEPTENVKVGSVEGKERNVKGLGVGGVSLVQTKQEMVKDLDKPTENVKVGSVEGKGRHGRGLVVSGVSSVQIKEEKVEDLDKQKMVENKPREDCKDGINIQNGVKKESKDNNGLNRSGKSTHSMPNKLPLAQYLAELYLRNKNDTTKNASVVLEMNDDGVNQKDTRQPPVCVETPSLRWSLKRVVQKTKEEEELDKELEQIKPIWDEMERAMREAEAESEIGNLGTNRSPSPHCEHITILDEQLGIYCKLCGDVITEMKYISELVLDKYPNEGSRRRATIGGDDVSLFDRSHFNVTDDDDSKDNVSHTEVTVWDKIPDVKQTLYPHQQEGFEFIWRNLAGSIELQTLKNADPRSEGGCIISHAPGTGKTRLTIVFLKSYLKLFPKCLPIVVAPASLLLTWEEEFKKWDVGVPFHNLSNLELSGKEHADVFNRFSRFNTRDQMNETRIAKLISWYKETSILGISYSLYGQICHDKEKKKNENVKARKGNYDIQKVLLEAPGLLVLDEGHTPRNQRSHIWKVLTKKSQTQKRIILSGTPFQNNFWELYCTLSLVKPSFPNKIPPELKKFCLKQRLSSEKYGWEQVSGNTARNPSDDDEIEKLKLLMDPFVHVHKGAILESKLPGLKECLVTLKAGSLQNEILKGIKRSQNRIFNFERKIALTSVHPSLFLECDLSEAEKSVLDKDRLKQIRLNPHEGVKTKFVYEFVRLCDASNEKVIVFSQFHAPLELIQDQLNSAFNWSKGEVLFMSSKDSPKVKQSIIHNFNDENSNSKILLAATKACSEGISLVGASRVVLLDVVWNPSVERQAISRAYRIGQKKVVYTYHLLAEGTTEEQKYGKQAEKDRLSELLFSAKNATDNDDVPKKRSVNFEDSVLDKMTQHEKLIDMFVKCVVLRKERDLV